MASAGSAAITGVINQSQPLRRDIDPVSTQMFCAALAQSLVTHGAHFKITIAWELPKAPHDRYRLDIHLATTQNGPIAPTFAHGQPVIAKHGTCRFPLLTIQAEDSVIIDQTPN